MTASACPSRRRAAELEALKFVTNSGIWPDPAPFVSQKQLQRSCRMFAIRFLPNARGRFHFPIVFMGTLKERSNKQIKIKIEKEDAL